MRQLLHQIVLGVTETYTVQIHITKSRYHLISKWYISARKPLKIAKLLKELIISGSANLKHAFKTRQSMQWTPGYTFNEN